ncbi:MAG: hypothetical protein ACLUPV_02330 [Bilophila wadsworthia]
MGVNDVFDVRDIQHHAFGMVAKRGTYETMGVANPEMAGLARTAVDELQRSPLPCAMAFDSLESPLILLSSARDAPDEGGRGSTAVPSMLPPSRHALGFRV